MTIHIKGAKIIAMDAAHGSETFDGDILIEGQRIVAMGAALPEAGADEFYHADLVGVAVEDRAGKALGTIIAVHDFGAGPILE
ncbi:MAG: hypothetical protein QF767_08895, partial [Alphaproteobacteria bacterium]|nr:hypothetical protein [Alphaproteobacteria bacterium]